jgi:hypothetical protein
MSSAKSLAARSMYSGRPCCLADARATAVAWRLAGQDARLERLAGVYAARRGEEQVVADHLVGTARTVSSATDEMSCALAELSRLA